LSKELSTEQNISITQSLTHSICMFIVLLNYLDIFVERENEQAVIEEIRVLVDMRLYEGGSESFRISAVTFLFIIIFQ